jgi:hypothetical protein
MNPLLVWGGFALVFLFAASYQPTAPYALGIAALVLLSQLVLLKQKGYNL